jgi:hypothetical protein
VLAAEPSVDYVQAPLNLSLSSRYLDDQFAGRNESRSRAAPIVGDREARNDCCSYYYATERVRIRNEEWTVGSPIPACHAGARTGEHRGDGLNWAGSKIAASWLSPHRGSSRQSLRPTVRDE